MVRGGGGEKDNQREFNAGAAMTITELKATDTDAASMDNTCGAS